MSTCKAAHTTRVARHNIARPSTTMHGEALELEALCAANVQQQALSSRLGERAAMGAPACAGCGKTMTVSNSISGVVVAGSTRVRFLALPINCSTRSSAAQALVVVVMGRWCGGGMCGLH